MASGGFTFLWNEPLTKVIGGTQLGWLNDIIATLASGYDDDQRDIAWVMKGFYHSTNTLRKSRNQSGRTCRKGAQRFIFTIIYE